MSTLKILQTNLNRIMADRGLTQIDVAMIGGISQSSVSNACRAIRGQHLDIIDGLSKGLGITTAKLLSPTITDDQHDVGRIVEICAELKNEGRSQVLRVAEMELRYQEDVLK